MLQNQIDSVLLVLIFPIIILLTFVGFIILVVVVNKKKQTVFIQDKLLQEIEYRNDILEKELEIQKKIEEERQRISHDMHDDLGAGISALKLQAEFLKQKIEDQNLKEDIDELIKISEEINLSMREMLWSLNSNNDNLGDFMKFIVAYAENFLKKVNVEIKVKRKVDFPEIKLNSVIRRNLFLCAKEAINNIYKHSKAKNIEVLFTLKDQIFIMEIIDDGVGLADSTQYGNGLNNMQKRLRNLCGHFAIKPTEKGLHLIFEITL